MPIFVVSEIKGNFTAAEKGIRALGINWINWIKIRSLDEQVLIKPSNGQFSLSVVPHYRGIFEAIL